LKKKKKIEQKKQALIDKVVSLFESKSDFRRHLLEEVQADGVQYYKFIHFLSCGCAEFIHRAETDATVRQQLIYKQQNKPHEYQEYMDFSASFERFESTVQSYLETNKLRTKLLPCIKILLQVLGTVAHFVTIQILDSSETKLTDEAALYAERELDDLKVISATFKTDIEQEISAICEKAEKKSSRIY